MFGFGKRKGNKTRLKSPEAFLDNGAFAEGAGIRMMKIKLRNGETIRATSNVSWVELGSIGVFKEDVISIEPDDEGDGK